ncbi:MULTISPECIES: cupin domain-containing protein [Flavobacterium]|jgi:quercetin dioxygenase-like cupin family protein|nr:MULTISPECIES: cupin domain-containing protein [Flavobacterium]MCM0666769.1 cupin domain-containing protein [Flavobacterium tyrosinilyticum]PBI94405.1 Cupin domain protein [Flavobacterium sp. ACN2]
MSTHFTAVTEEGKIPNTYMTGEVSYKKQTSEIHPENTVIKDISFEPGARSNWHSNASLQLIIVTDGVGYYQERGGQINLIEKGKVITVLPGIEHWYGATPTTKYSHITIVTEIDKGHGTWLESVTDEEYYSFERC